MLIELRGGWVDDGVVVLFGGGEGAEGAQFGHAS